MQLTTTTILGRLRAIAEADIRKVMKWSARSIKAVSSSKLTADQAAAVSEVRKLPDGTVVVKLRDPVPALRLLGAHMGLFSGEVAAAPSGDTVINNDNRTLVYVDRPPDETAEQWEARQRKPTRP